MAATDAPSWEDPNHAHKARGIEKAAYLDNAIRYQASITFLNGKIQSLRAALKGEA